MKSSKIKSADNEHFQPEPFSKWTHLLIVFILLVTPPLHTIQLLFHFSTHVAGDSMDTAEFLLNEWWTAHALLDLRTNPFLNTHMFYPLGLNMVQHTYNFLDGLGYTLFRPFLSLIVFHNLLLWLTFFLNSLAAYLLIFHLTRLPWLAFVGATAFSHSPTLMSYMKIPCLLELYILVFFIFSSYRLMTTGKIRWAVYSGVLLGLSLYNYPYYFIFGLIWLGLLLINQIWPWRFQSRNEARSKRFFQVSCWIGLTALLLILISVFAPRSYWELIIKRNLFFWVPLLGFFLFLAVLILFLKRRPGKSPGGYPLGWSPLPLKDTVSGLILGLLVLFIAGLVGFPYFQAFLTDQATRLAVQSRPIEFITYNVDVTSFFAPFNPLLEGAYKWIASDWVTGRPIMATPAFLGYGFMVLLLIGFRDFLIRQEIRIWFIAWFVFLVLSLGPFLKIHGIIYNHLILPGFFLFQLPLLNSTRTVSRFLAPMMLLTSIISCLVLKMILEKCPARWRSFLLGGVFLIIIFEYGLVPFPYQSKMTSFQVPEVYRVLAEKSKGKTGVLLDLPLFTHSGDRSEGLGETKRLYFQTVHQQKMVGGVSSKTDPKVFDFFQNQPGIPSFWSAAPLSEKEFSASLTALHINWIILDKSYFKPDNLKTYLHILNTVPTLHTFYEDQRYLGVAVNQL